MPLLRESPCDCAKSLESSEKVTTAVYESACAHVSGRGSVRVSVNASGRDGRVRDHGSVSDLRPDGGAAGM